MEEAFLELAGGGPAAGIDFTAFLQPDLCETDHYPAEQAQLGTKWGIYYNIDKNKFEKKEIIKEVINSK